MSTSTSVVATYEQASQVVSKAHQLYGHLKTPELRKLLVEKSGDQSFLDSSNESREKLLEYLENFERASAATSSNASSLSENDLTHYSVPFSEIEFDPKKDLIAEGAFGVVYKGTARGTPCAIKIMKNRIRPASEGEIRKEIAVCATVKNPHICLFLGSSMSPDDEVVVLMELMKGDLETYLREHRKSLTQDRKLEIILDVARGLTWLHSLATPIIHLDLKLENILYDESSEKMKIADFGLAALIPPNHDAIKSDRRSPGNVGHMSPEVIENKAFTTKADVFSFGTLVWEILSGHEWEEDVFDHLEAAQIPLDSPNIRWIVKQAVVHRNFRPLINKKWSDPIKKLLNDCWNADPNIRPTMKQIISDYLPAIVKDLHTSRINKWLAHDKLAHSFWKKYYPTETSATKGVDYLSFSKKFYRHILRLPFPNDCEKNVHYLFLKLALNAINMQSSEQVFLIRFAQLTAAFGPLIQYYNRKSKIPDPSTLELTQPTKTNGTSSSSAASSSSADSTSIPLGVQFLLKISEVLSNRWFHPEIATQQETMELLRGQPDGTFFVRFSNQPGVAYTIARASKGKLCQTRVKRTRKPPIQFIVDHKGLRHLQFESLDQMISSGTKVTTELRITDYLRFTLTAGEKLFTQPLEADNSYLQDTDIAEELTNANSLSASTNSPAVPYSATNDDDDDDMSGISDDDDYTVPSNFVSPPSDFVSPPSIPPPSLPAPKPPL